MDDLRMSRQAALNWLEERAREAIIEGSREGWTAEEVADTVADIIGDVRAVAGWSACDEVIIFECPMAPDGCAVKPA